MDGTSNRFTASPCEISAAIGLSVCHSDVCECECASSVVFHDKINQFLEQSRTRRTTFQIRECEMKIQYRCHVCPFPCAFTSSPTRSLTIFFRLIQFPLRNRRIRNLWFSYRATNAFPSHHSIPERVHVYRPHRPPLAGAATPPRRRQPMSSNIN